MQLDPQLMNAMDAQLMTATVSTVNDCNWIHS